jgi:transposase
MVAGTEAPSTKEIERLLGPQLTPEEARLIYEQGPEAVVFALLTLTKRLAEKQPTAAAPDPSTPSGMKAPYQKPPGKKRTKRRGRKKGHPGSRRATPLQIDRHQEHTLDTCPQCHGPVTPCQQTRARIIEDIPEDIKPEVTEHTLHRYWCPQCSKTVEPKVAEALPGSTLGLRVLVLTAWLHYALGNTLSQILEVFNFHLQMKLTGGGLVQMWYRLQEILFAWYLDIQSQALAAGVLHADETGWRVAGKTCWLWCFTTADLTFYLIDRCRGSSALKKFFQKHFAGILVTDFWAAYNAIVCAHKQKCLPHLLRELKKVERYHQPDADWKAFAKKLRRLIRDAIRLSKRRHQLSKKRFAALRQRVQKRLQELLDAPWTNRDARRLLKRLRRHAQELFTFLDHPEVPFDNNHAERTIRPAVIIRKNSYANGSQDGADLQAVLMSIFRTLKQRGHNPVQAVVQALRSYLKTGQLPPLPAKVTGDG